VKIAEARDATGAFARFVQRRQQDAYQHRDDADDNQQLHKCETNAAAI